MSNGSVEGLVVAMLNIQKALIPCAWMLGVVHVQDMPDHPVDYLCLPVGLGVEGGQFGQLGVHQRPQAGSPYLK